MASLNGYLGFKGERGYSAYEIAVQNGYEGTEQDWLANLGTSSSFKKTETSYTTTANQSTFDVPSDYTSSSFLDVYVDGKRLNSSEYTIADGAITLTSPIEDEGVNVEVVVTTMTSNNLPISNIINSSSTDDTASSSKAVYDFMTESISDKYTKEEVDNLLADKVNSADVYTKTETYTQEEVDNKISNFRNIYIGTSDPSSSLGSDGDVYIKYS